MGGSSPGNVVDSGLFVRFYLDEDVHKRVALALRLRHFDAISVHETGRRGLRDDEQLALAATDGRVLVTYNTADFIRLHLAWVQHGRAHSGIVVSDQVSVSETTKRLLQFANRVSADEAKNQLYWLQAFK